MNMFRRALKQNERSTTRRHSLILRNKYTIRTRLLDKFVLIGHLYLQNLQYMSARSYPPSYFMNDVQLSNLRWQQEKQDWSMLNMAISRLFCFLALISNNIFYAM